MRFSKYEIKLPDNHTVGELKEAATQARQFAEERRGQATMWDSYADTLERRANELQHQPCVRPPYGKDKAPH